MDVRGLFILTCVIASAVCEPMIQDGEAQSADDDVTTEAVIVETTAVPEVKNCSTARDIAGACVSREFCDYGTPAIDLTLFAPRAYVKPCRSDEVCCPFDAVLEPSGPSSEGTPDSFDFDEDD